MKTCYVCGLDKADDDFNFRNRLTGRLDSHCRICRNAYSKQWYNKPENKKVHRARLKRQKKQRKRRGSWYIERAKNIPCSDCGKKFPTVCMHFDHMPGFVKI